MSRILHEATLRALDEAYRAYLAMDAEDFAYHLQVAENAIKAIEDLGHDPQRGRELEVLFLRGEKTLISAFGSIQNPRRLLDHYRAAALQIPFPPSLVLTAEMAYLPPCGDLSEFLQIPGDNPREATEDFAEAIGVYSSLTNGGGAGADLLYRAVAALKQGEYTTATRLTEEAQQVGRPWIVPHTQRLLTRIQGTKEGKFNPPTPAK